MSENTTAVEAFAGQNYSGASLPMAEGYYDTETLNRAFGQGGVYSLKVTSGYSVTICTAIGAYETFTTDTPRFSDYLNGKITSVRVFETPASQQQVASVPSQVVFIQPPAVDY